MHNTQELQDSLINRTGGEVAIFASKWSTEEVLRYFAENKIPAKVVLGSYKSTYETAYMVPMPQFTTLMSTTMLDDQESVLFLSNPQKTGERLAYLWYIATDAVEPLGAFSNIPAENLPDAFTYDPFAGLYYGTRAVNTAA